MTILIASDTPDAIRGILKRWFIEPKPNVFVGTVNRKVRDKTLEYIRRNAKDMNLLIISSEPNCQGYRIEHWGTPDRRDTEFSGIQLIAENWINPEKIPF